MTKMHFQSAASMVRNILDGKWTHEPPDWAPRLTYPGFESKHDEDEVRAVQTAEAFIILFRQFNPRFDVDRFLIACGLADAPKKGRK